MVIKMSKVDIKFGTAGWRGIISDDFTFANVRLVSQAIADLINSGIENPAVVIGYDTRFLSEKFAVVSAEVLAANGIKVYYSEKDVPTPVISYYIRSNSLAGGINITASHNPPEYSGIKFSPASGGPALPETTSIIEENCRRILSDPGMIKSIDFDDGVKEGIIEIKDLSSEYIQTITRIIDVPLVEKELKFAFDAMYGTAREYIPRIFPNSDMTLINNHRDVLFGGHRPEPAMEYLGKLRDTVINKNMDIGISTDGDADRFGIMDSDGTFITPNEVMGLALYHLHKKGYRGVAARSVMTSSFMDAVAGMLDVEVIETPVGFKYIGNVFVEKDMIVGGEESGGLTIGGHLPEKDGIVACLLMAELRASENKSLGAILEELYGKVGRFVTLRKNYTLSSAHMETLRSSLESELPGVIGDFKVDSINRLDGYKFIMEESNTWLGLRFSGTEPVVRIYAESSSEQNISRLIDGAEKFFKLN